ncbi:hypothetical protein MMC25_004729, partial [Agyrium rufum]|nr:hypothetical protein [Agyrium rufum]
MSFASTHPIGSHLNNIIKTTDEELPFNLSASGTLPPEPESLGVPNNRPKTKRPQLSCSACRLRKVKCNRVLPCSACSLNQNSQGCHYDLSDAERKPILQAEALRKLEKSLKEKTDALAQLQETNHNLSTENLRLRQSQTLPMPGVRPQKHQISLQAASTTDTSLLMVPRNSLVSLPRTLPAMAHPSPAQQVQPSPRWISQDSAPYFATFPASGPLPSQAIEAKTLNRRKGCQNPSNRITISEPCSPTRRDQRKYSTSSDSRIRILKKPRPAKHSSPKASNQYADGLLQAFFQTDIQASEPAPTVVDFSDNNAWPMTSPSTNVPMSEATTANNSHALTETANAGPLRQTTQGGSAYRMFFEAMGPDGVQQWSPGLSGGFIQPFERLSFNEGATNACSPGINSHFLSNMPGSVYVHPSHCSGASSHPLEARSMSS